MNDSPDSGFDHGSYLTEPIEATYRFPWPPPEDAPLVAGFVATWREAVLHPVRFFRAMPADASLGPALLYYLIIGIVAAAIELFWSSVLPRPDDSTIADVLGQAAAGASPLVDFLMSPLLLLLSLFLASAVTHVMVLMLVPGNRGFGSTLRIFCYAYSPAIFAVVPYAGSVAAFLWMTVLSVVGIREVNRTTAGRAATAVLVPLIIASLFMAMAYLLLRSGALLTP